MYVDYIMATKELKSPWSSKGPYWRPRPGRADTDLESLQVGGQETDNPVRELLESLRAEGEGVGGTGRTDLD